MKITILGKYGVYAPAKGCCPGYLVQNNNTNVLIDCGNGSLSRMLEIIGLESLDAVILSHLHSDHISDIFILRYALSINAARGMKLNLPMTVYLPENPREDFDKIEYKNVFELIPIKSDLKAIIGELKFTFQQVTHPIQTFAVKIKSGTKELVYSSDTSYDENLIDFARGADLLIADAGLLEKDKVGTVNHMSGLEVGRVGKEAGVKRLVLSHIYPSYDEKELLLEACQDFKEAELALEMVPYDLTI